MTAPGRPSHQARRGHVPHPWSRTTVGTSASWSLSSPSDTRVTSTEGTSIHVVLRLLIDTSVWLDIARRRDGQKWVVPIRVLKHQGYLELPVPGLVLDEFDRNRPRAELAVTAQVRERFRLLRADLTAYVDDDRRKEWLEELTHQIPLLSSRTLQNFAEISDLLRSGKGLVPTRNDYARVIQRGLDKKAHLHLNKNSVADAPADRTLPLHRE